MLDIVIYILIACAIVALFFASHLQATALANTNDVQARQIDALTATRKELTAKVNSLREIHNATVEHYDEEIDQIIERMNHIIEDIERIDRDEKDLRSYYVNYRTPALPRGGVEWASEFPTQEEEHGEIESD